MTIVCSPSLSGIRKSRPAHGNSGLEVRFVSLSELQDCMDSTVPVYFDWAYLKAVSSNDSDGLRHIFPCVFRDGLLLAFGAFCLLKRDKKSIAQAIADQGNAGRLWKQTLKSVLPFTLGSCDTHLQILIAGNMLVSGPYGLHFTNQCNSEWYPLIWEATIQAADAQFGVSALTVVKDYRVDNGSHSKPILFGFEKLKTLPLMVLPLDPLWYNFTDYLEAMSTKYRTRARAALQKAGSLNTTYWDAAQIRANKQQIYTLYLEVYKRAKFRIQPVNENYILQLAEGITDGRFRFIAWMDGVKLVGFSTAFFHGERLDAHLIGMDYSYNKSHSLYLNMIYRYIQDGLDMRVKLVDFGRTAMEIKSTAGAVPHELEVLIRLRLGMGNKLAGRLISKIKLESWIQRHPFKEMHPA